MGNNFWTYHFARMFVKLWVHLYFKRIILVNKEKMPLDKPLVIVMNHQNSFMDAFSVVVKYPLLAHFMTNAAVFNIPVVKSILKACNLIPIYRARDGMSNLTKNNEIFELCFDLLNSGSSIFIFPEANHDLKRRLRILSKGFSRIIFGAMEKYDWEMDLHVLPISLNYSDHRYARQTIRAILHDPIPMKEYKEVYKEDPKKAALRIRDEVYPILKDDLVHVPTVDEYAAYHILLDELENNDLDLTNPKLQNARIERIKEHLSKDDVLAAKELQTTLEKNNIRLKWALRKNSFGNILSLLIGLPILINNLIPYWPIHHLVKNVIKDHAFDTSIKVLAAGIIFPVYYLMVSGLIYLISSNWIYSGVYLAFSLLTVVSFPYLKKVILRILHKNRLSKLMNDSMQETIDRFKELRSIILSSE